MDKVRNLIIVDMNQGSMIAKTYFIAKTYNRVLSSYLKGP